MSIIVVYIVGGILAGALLGSMAFFLKGKIGSFFLGMFAMLPIGFGILITENDFAGWTRTDTITLALLASCLGGPGGLVLREMITRSGAKDY